MAGPPRKGRRKGEAGPHSPQGKVPKQDLPESMSNFILNTPDGIVLTDEKGIVVVWNPAAERITGWGPPQVLGMPIWEVQARALPAERRTDEVRRYLETTIREALATGQATWLNQVGDEVFLRPDGERRILQAHTFTVRTGRGYRIGSIMRDVTAQRATERALGESQERFRVVSELTSDFAYTFAVSPDGTLVLEWITEAFTRITGYRPEELWPAGNWMSIIHPEDLPLVRERMGVVLQGQPDDGEARIITKDGRAHWLHIFTHPEWDEAQGRVVRVYGAVRDIDARKKAEEALKESEERYRLLTESSQDFIYIIDRQGRLEYLNAAAARLFGSQPQELVGRRVADLFAPGTFERQQGNLERVLQTGQPLDITAKTVVGTREIWQDTSLIPLRDDTGQVRAVMGVSRDVTARRQAQEALQASERQYRTTIDSMGDPIHVVDRDLRLVLCNKALQRWCEELQLGSKTIGLTVFELFPFLTERVRGEYEQVFQTGQVLVTEESTRAHGREFFTETRKIPVYEDGQVVRVITVIRDISERKQAEAMLWQTKMVVEHSPMILYRLRAEEGWPFDFVSDNVDQSGYTAAELLSGQVPFTSLVHPDDLTRVLGEMEAHAEQGKDAFRREYRAIIKSGQVRWVEDRVVIVRDPEGRVTHYQGVLLDITENKRLEEQFRQAQKMETVGRLAGGVAHDFNNFLTAIRGYAGLAHDALRPEDPVRADVEQVLKAAERATALTSQLLAFSRRQIIEIRPANLNDLILDMEKMVRRLIGEDVELEVHLAPDLGLVRVDPGQITQALVNLLVNARDAMPDGGVVAITTANVTLDEAATRAQAGLAPGPFIRLEVRDSGVGMSDEVQSHLFEPFFTTKEAGHGTGLGLASVYGIVKQHQGHVVIQSQAGLGTTVQIYLPRFTGPAYPPARHEAAQPPPRGHETVLVVEDEPAVRALMVRVLRSAGYTVLEAQNGNEAIHVVRGHRGPVHLLLTDVVMPQMDGKVLTGLLQDAHPELRVLYVSGYATDVLSRHGILQEGIDLLQKPFSGAVLAGRVRQALDRAVPEEAKGD